MNIFRSIRRGISDIFVKPSIVTRVSRVVNDQVTDHPFRTGFVAGATAATVVHYAPVAYNNLAARYAARQLNQAQAQTQSQNQNA